MAVQTRLLEVFRLHGLDVAVGLNANGVMIGSQDERVDAKNLGEIKAYALSPRIVSKTPDLVLPGDSVVAPQAHRMEGRTLDVTDVLRPNGGTWVIYVEDADDPTITGEIRCTMQSRVQVIE